MPGSSLRGQLLVAAPDLADPNFHRTVVLLLAHGDDGALGVVLNRPGGLPVTDPVPAWAPLAAPPAMVFVGGPVSPDVAVALGRVGDHVGGSATDLIVDRVGVVDLNSDVDRVEADIETIRIFGGHAGWGPGQLEAELAERAWFVLPAAPDDPFCPDPGEQWREVLGRQTGPLRRLRHFPDDVRSN